MSCSLININLIGNEHISTYFNQTGGIAVLHLEKLPRGGGITCSTRGVWGACSHKIILILDSEITSSAFSDK